MDSENEGFIPADACVVCGATPVEIGVGVYGQCSTGCPLDDTAEESQVIADGGT